MHNHHHHNLARVLTAQDFAQLQELEYVIDGVDRCTGKAGAFVFDSDRDGLWAISPVFASVRELFEWCSEQGFTKHSDKPYTVCRPVCRP